MTNTRTFAVHYLGRCRCTGKARITAQMTVTTRTNPGSSSPFAMNPFPRTNRTVKVVFPHGPTLSADSLERVSFICLCGRSVEFTRVHGRVTAHKCNVKCLDSTSGVCECSCGGKNHGASHEVSTGT